MNRAAIVTPIGVRGRIVWRAYDPQGRPLLVRSRDARGRERYIGGGEQSNLITDNGMNALAGSWANGYGVWLANTTSTVAENIRRYARFGTGSSAPSVTDSTLDAQVLASNSSGSFAAFDLEGEGVENDWWHARYMYRRLAQAASSVNLTEFGLSYSESDSDLAIRELFRDEFGDPITLTIPEGAFIRLDHWLELQLDLSESTGTLTIEEYDILGALVTTHDIDYAAKWWTAASGADSDNIKTRHITAALEGAGNTSAAVTGVHSARCYRASSLNPALPSTFAGSTGVAWASLVTQSGITTDHPSYVAGSHEIARRFVFDAAIQNGDWTGYGRGRGTLVQTTQVGGGLLIAFRNSGVHVKEDTHQLTWEHRFSWARA